MRHTLRHKRLQPCVLGQQTAFCAHSVCSDLPATSQAASHAHWRCLVAGLLLLSDLLQSALLRFCVCRSFCWPGCLLVTAASAGATARRALRLSFCSTPELVVLPDTCTAPPREVYAARRSARPSGLLHKLGLTSDGAAPTSSRVCCCSYCGRACRWKVGGCGPCCFCGPSVRCSEACSTSALIGTG